MVNNVIGVVNYVIATVTSLLNYVIADSHRNSYSSAYALEGQPVDIWSPGLDGNLCGLYTAAPRRRPTD
jgi:hypothetical protein